MAASWRLIDSVYYEFNIHDYQDLEGFNQVLLEEFETPRRKLNWLTTVEPIVQRDEDFDDQIIVELKTKVNEVRMNVEVDIIFGDEQHQRIRSGVRVLKIGGGDEEYGVNFLLKLGEVGTQIEDLRQTPRYTQQGSRSTVRLGIRVAIHKVNEPVIITL